MLATTALGALLGAAVGPVVADRLATPEEISGTRWRVITPGLREQVASHRSGRGTHVVGGALVMTGHAFFRPDMLVALSPQDPHRVELSFAPGSGAVDINIGTPPIHATLSPDGYTTRSDGPLTSGSSDYEIVHDAGRFLLTPRGGVPDVIGYGAPGPLELSTAGEQTRLSRVRLLGADGAVLLDEDFTTSRRSAEASGWGAAAGGLVGLCLGAVGLGALPWLLPPLLVLSISSSQWLLLAERLYLAETPAWELARLALAASALPLIFAALLRTPLLQSDLSTHGRDPLVRRLWWVAAAAAVLLASHIPESLSDVLVLLSGVVLVVSMGVLGRTLPAVAWLGRDLVLLVLLAAVGWSGVLLLIVGRLLIVAGAARALLSKAPQSAANLLLLLLLALPSGVEGAIRLSYLESAWDVTRLSRELPAEQGWQNVSASWTGRCPPEDAAWRRVAFLGGSSTGGAYQFGEEGEAFFAARAHAAGCEAGLSLRTWNFGTGDGNTFTISRTIKHVFRQTQAELLVMYVGVNDLLTQHHPQTRKQREAALEAQRRSTQGLLGLGRRLRLVTGASLLLKPLPGHEDNVSTVPLSDAEENHALIARAAAEQGAHVLLLTELIRSPMGRELAGYDELQQRIAADNDHVTWVDARELIGGGDVDALLVDRNHLSREGNARLGAALAPIIRAQLDLIEAR
ncbi:MAG: hypothetical protein ACI8S6_002149 [Myxococcota bacterium]|jgi:hypothetical protein